LVHGRPIDGAVTLGLMQPGIGNRRAPQTAKEKIREILHEVVEELNCRGSAGIFPGPSISQLPNRSL